MGNNIVDRNFRVNIMNGNDKFNRIKCICISKTVSIL